MNKNIINTYYEFFRDQIYFLKQIGGLKKQIKQLESKLNQEKKYPTAFQCVDIAIINYDNLPADIGCELLVGRKPNVEKFQFIGGFSDPTTISLEQDAKREAMEETGLEVDNIKYIGSTLIDDERYRDSVDKIKTALFVAKRIFGKASASDDIFEVCWIPIYAHKTLAESIDKNLIVAKHHVLVDMLIDYLSRHPLLDDPNVANYYNIPKRKSQQHLG